LSAPVGAGIMAARPLRGLHFCPRKGASLLPTVSRRRLPVATLLVVVLAACSSAASTTPLPSGAEPPADCVRVEDGVITISAADLEFSAPCMVANAGEGFTIRLTNDDSVPHNVAVYQDSSKANEIMRGEIINQGQSDDVEVEAQDAGQYYFDCQLHPDMNGTLYVV
jgi:plastocyanin